MDSVARRLGAEITEEIRSDMQGEEYDYNKAEQTSYNSGNRPFTSRNSPWRSPHTRQICTSEAGGTDYDGRVY